MPDLEFEAEQSQSSQSQLKRQRIRDVKRFILAKLETEIQQQPSHESNLIPHIRLVSHGRLCSDSVLLATLFVGGGRSDSGSVPQAELGDTVVYLHAIITYEPRSSNESNLDTSSIAGEQQDEEEDHQEHDQPQQEQQIRPPRGGFDRLLDVGFPQEQVDQLRDQFQQVNNNNNNSAFITGPDGRPAPNFALEDEWMESNIINPESSSSFNFDLLSGLLLGFILGLMTLIIIRINNEKHFSQGNLLNRRQLLGAYTGLVINIAFGILLSFNSNNSDVEQSGFPTQNLIL